MPRSMWRSIHRPAPSRIGCASWPGSMRRRRSQAPTRSGSGCPWRSSDPLGLRQRDFCP